MFDLEAGKKRPERDIARGWQPHWWYSSDLIDDFYVSMTI